MELMIVGGAFASVVSILSACMVLAWFTDHEAAGATGVMKEGQVW